MKPQNVIVIMSDEHDPRVMGCSGHPLVQTPHLDALAQRGLRFENAYTPSPICVPARAAFASGRRVHQTGHWDNAIAYAGQPSSWGHALQAHGVRVESIGKLHYETESSTAGFQKEHIPMHIAEGVGMLWGSIRDPYVSKRPGGQRMLGAKIGAGESTYTAYDRSITQTTVDWLRDAATRPQEGFVLFVGLVAPHFPLLAPSEFFSMYPLDQLPEPKLHPSTGYQRHPWVQAYADFSRSEELFTSPEERLRAFAAYFGLCSFLDHNIGEVLRTLQELGLDEHTHVIYTSDHGDNLGARGLWGKSTLYQESVSVPLIVAGPRIDPGVCQTPVDLLDLYPTILELAGKTAPAHEPPRPGRSLLSIAAAPYDSERVVFSEYHAAGSNTGAFMVRKGRWKLHHYVRFEPELFDLEEDPEELHNLASVPECAHILQDMQQALRGICDPEQVDAQAKHDQAELIERMGGLAFVSTLGTSGATPAPAPAPAGA